MSARATAALAALLAAAAGPLRAQELAPKRELLGGPVAACESAAAPAAAAGSAPAAAVDSLLAAGSRAAILGDQPSARALFQKAAALDPRSAVAAYRLARTDEEMGQGESAVTEYCRYLALSPSASNAAEVRERIEVLAPPPASDLPPEALNYLRAGLDAYDHRDFDRAAYSFTVVLRGCDSCASVHFDRGLANAARQRNADAVADLRRYLQLRPAAPDASQVRAYLSRLQSTVMRTASTRPAPAGVLVQGLVVPGLGQFATGRPALGVLVLGSVVGALYYGSRPHAVVRTYQAEDPFGETYEYQRTVRERTHLGIGLGIAASVSLVSALEAYLHAAGGR